MLIDFTRTGVLSGLAGVIVAGFISVQPASAVTFAGNYSVDAHDSGNGLLIETNLLNGGNLNFNLNSVGQSHTTNLFTIWTDETDVGWDDKTPRPITATFNFTSPVGTGSVGGSTVGQSVFYGIIQAGSVTWNPATFNLGNYVLSVVLSNEIFNLGFFGLHEGQKWGATVAGTFTLTSVSAVPLPPAVLLFASGLAGIGFLSRRRKAKAGLSQAA
jgi:hypothetical protein